MKIYCNSCGNLIPPQDLNLQTNVAKCFICNNVFYFLDQLEIPEKEEKIDESKNLDLINKGFKVEYYGNDLVISKKWLSSMFFFLVFFCIAWDSFLFFWYTMAFKSKDISWIMIIFPIFHVIVGIGLTYYTIAGFINKTIIKISSGLLTVKHLPLPFFKSLEIETSKIIYFYIEEHKSDDSSTYTLFASLKTDEIVKILGNPFEYEELIFVKKKLNKHLNV